MKYKFAIFLVLVIIPTTSLGKVDSSAQNELDIVYSNGKAPRSSKKTSRNYELKLPEREKCPAGSYYDLGEKAFYTHVFGIETKLEYQEYRICYNLQRDLSLAASKGDKLKILELFQKGANPNATLDAHSLAIFSTILPGRIELLKLFVKNGANVNIIQGISETLLFRAVEKKLPEAVHFLLENSANPCRRRETELISTNEAIIGLARKLRNREIIKLLEAAGADKCVYRKLEK